MKNTDLTKRLNLFRRQLRFSQLFFGFFLWAVSSLALWLVFFIIDNLLVLPSGLRLPLTFAGLVTMGIIFYKLILLPARHQIKLSQSALAMEKKFNVAENLLINAYYFEQAELKQEERMFAQQTIDHSTKLASRRPLFEKKDLQGILKRAGIIFCLLLLWIAYVVSFPHHAVNALIRYSQPLADVPPVSKTKLIIHPDKNIKIMEGENLTINLQMSANSKQKNTNPPIIAWQDGSKYFSENHLKSKNSAMTSYPENREKFSYTFNRIKRPFAFRVFGGGTYTRSIRVDVDFLPKISKSTFRIIRPEYTGKEPELKPGPPASLSYLRGSRIDLTLAFDNQVNSLLWQDKSQSLPFKQADNEWVLSGIVPQAGEYTIYSIHTDKERKIPVANGQISIIEDQSPEITFTESSRNLMLPPGAALSLGVMATDDYGIKDIDIQVSPLGSKTVKPLKNWAYLGPPGNGGPIAEQFTCNLSPAIFKPGGTYLINAICSDYSPEKINGQAKPLIVRIKSLEQLQVENNNPLAQGMDLLRKCIEAQTQANGSTENVRINLDEIIAKKNISAHRKSMLYQQNRAKILAQSTITAFRKAKAELYLTKLESLVNGEMKWAAADIAKLSDKNKELKPTIKVIGDRQAFILQELISLLGKIDQREKEAAKSPESKTAALELNEAENDLMIDFAKQLKNDLEDFAREEKRSLEMAKNLLADGPEDLTNEEEAILGELAREQAKWANLFQEKLTDFSKLPLQDFADGSIAEEYNEIYQEIKLAEKSLYEKKIELAVPHEQSGIEKAEELVHNLERWLPDTPDNKKWLMEEPLTPAEIPLAELPLELEDIVGELLDSEEEMTDAVEDVTSSWMDSLDKGAGWGASDGPISNMSARGVTGNLLPNQNEVGGRSGEGRTGRSHGQMVEASAEGKGGRDTPTRLTPSPFEQGSIEDSSKDPTGGSTGGGKLSGATGEGLMGPVPPAMAQQLARLGGRQTQIRQQAENFNLKLKSFNLPTGDMETSINYMKQFEKAAKRGHGPSMRQAHSRIMEHLKQSRNHIGDASRIFREKNNLPESVRAEINSGLQEGIPKGYEEIVGEYFKVLAEQGVE